jgi:hypothetical protein
VDLQRNATRTEYDRSAALRIAAGPSNPPAVMCLPTAEKVQRKSPPTDRRAQLRVRELRRFLDEDLVRGAEQVRHRREVPVRPRNRPRRKLTALP